MMRCRAISTEHGTEDALHNVTKGTVQSAADLGQVSGYWLYIISPNANC